ncbi:MAG: trypsin-like peptidase domain-containing protein [Patescibacteria group bacterium]
MSEQKNLWLTAILSSVITLLVIVIAGSAYMRWHGNELFANLAAKYLQSNASPTKPSNLNLLSPETIVVATVAKASPAVISIVVTKDVPVIEQYYEEFDPFGDFFGPLGFQIPRQRSGGTERREIGGGSGFIVAADGLAITNRHVVEDKDASYTAVTSSGNKYPVEVVARDPILDVAIIKIKGPNNFHYLTFGDSDTLKVGQSAIAIGNALGEFKNTVSVGVISGLYRSIVAADAFGQSEQLDEVIQTDAAINPGNSGGPLITLDGRVVGVNVAVARGSENIGFALPANVVKSVVESVKKTGKIVRPYIGVRYTAITPALQATNKLPFDYGVLVARGNSQNEIAVIPGSPAGKAGVVENDIILEVDGVKLDDEHSLASLIRKQSVGQTVSLKIWHQGETKTVRLVLEAAKE